MVLNAILLAISAIRRNLMRSFLTTLGIIIGVGSVIVLVTLGNGATKSVTDSIRSMGANKLMLMPNQGRGPEGGARSENKLFSEADIEALRTEISGITQVSPQANAGMQAIYGNANYSTNVYGIDNEYMSLNNWHLDSGRQFTDAELDAGSAVCILGQTVRKQLFADADPMGNTIRIGNISCQVVGLLKSKGTGGMGMDEDNNIMVPIHTLQRRVTGTRKIEMVQIGYATTADSTEIKEEVKSLMRQRRRLQADQTNDFNIFDSAEILTTLTTSMKTMTMLLSAVAAISLLVGGIGIMNIMLVSVTERTREIGVRMAIGAYERDVMIQFLVEAVVLSALGGLLGIILGLSASVIGCKVMTVAYAPNWNVTALAFLFSALIGVVFGFFPARKAAKLDPIEALRHE